MTRKVEVNFAADERLFRSVAKDGVDARGKVKPQKLRLQISVAREKYGKSEDAFNPGQPHMNGIVTIEAGQAHGVSEGAKTMTAVVVDEPLPEKDAHALISLVAVPGVDALEDDVNDTRLAIAARMVVVTAPTKP